MESKRETLVLLEGMMSTRSLFLVAVVLLAASPGAARTRRHHAPASPASAPAAAPFSFYPENIEGGVPGNLSFNNQIRKHTDPLNANGGK